MIKKLVFWFALFVASSAFAHPVSFKGGTAVMPFWSASRQELEVNYSFTPRDALGFTAIRLDDKKAKDDFLFAQYNRLLYRDNELESQGNVYLMSGVGLKEDRLSASDRPAYLAGFQGDYETRRIYTLAAARLVGAPEQTFLRVQGRVGFAPYLADFDELHTWLITQIDYTPELQDTVTVTPMVRLFYQNYLLEVGASTRGDPMVSAITHF